MITNSDSLGIFDSGVGGLSVWLALNKLIPYENTIYVADQKYMPYGKKNTATIKKRAFRITEFLLRRGSSMIIIACHTATVAAIDSLRKEFSCTFVGIEPALKPAILESSNREIIVLATEMTLKSKRQRKLIHDYTHGVKINLFAAPQFVNLVESGDTASPSAKQVVAKYFQSRSFGKSDVLILACTHYPFLNDAFRDVLGNRIKILEPSIAVAKRVKSLRSIEKISNSLVGKHQFYTTGDPQLFRKVASQLIKRKIKVNKVNI